jgi:MFS family permease
VGFAGGLVVDSTGSALIGFACLGAGCASVIPTVLGAAGRITGVNSGSAVAAVAAFGWAGFVCGPPLIGQLASATSLRLALGLLPALTLLVAVTTYRAKALRRTAVDGLTR